MMPKYADFMFNLGLLDENQRDYFQSMTDKAVVYIQNQQYLEAFKVKSNRSMY